MINQALLIGSATDVINRDIFRSGMQLCAKREFLKAPHLEIFGFLYDCTPRLSRRITPSPLRSSHCIDGCSQINFSTTSTQIQHHRPRLSTSPFYYHEIAPSLLTDLLVSRRHSPRRSTCQSAQRLHSSSPSISRGFPVQLSRSSISSPRRRLLSSVACFHIWVHLPCAALTFE